MNITLSDLFTELNEVVRRSASGSLDNNKRARAINRALRRMRLIGDWFSTVRNTSFTFTDGTYEYSLQTDLSCTALSKDGSTSVPDFKNPYHLHRATDDETPFRWRDPKTVRNNIGRGKKRNEFAIDGDTIIINYEPTATTETKELDYFSLAMVKTNADAYQIEFNADDVTQTDYLIDHEWVTGLMELAKGEAFGLIGGKNEAERRDALQLGQEMILQLRRTKGRAIARPPRAIIFPGSR